MARTPLHPNFRWGKFLLFDHAPREGDAAVWRAHFAEEISARQPESRHVTFGVDCAAPFALSQDFDLAGLNLFESTVLTMRREQLRLTARVMDKGYRIDALRLPEQAAEVVDLQVSGDAGLFEPEAVYSVFRERQMQRHAAMDQAGMGRWFAVFAQLESGAERIVADCGLFRAPGESLGRLQHVQTHPAWRRRGLCSVLVHAVCRHGFERMELETLVIVADPENVAIGLYEALGFVRAASTWQIEKALPRPASCGCAP